MRNETKWKPHPQIYYITQAHHSTCIFSCSLLRCQRGKTDVLCVLLAVAAINTFAYCTRVLAIQLHADSCHFQQLVFSIGVSSLFLCTEHLVTYGQKTLVNTEYALIAWSCWSRHKYGIFPWRFKGRSGTCILQHYGIVIRGGGGGCHI